MRCGGRRRCRRESRGGAGRRGACRIGGLGALTKILDDAADGLTVAKIAELLQLSVPRVRQFIKQAHTPGTPEASPGTASE